MIETKKSLAGRDLCEAHREIDNSYCNTVLRAGQLVTRICEANKIGLIDYSGHYNLDCRHPWAYFEVGPLEFKFVIFTGDEGPNTRIEGEDLTEELLCKMIDEVDRLEDLRRRLYE